jgi:23S rRNA (cytosine1962-C5)-methyltransferase
MGEKDARQAEFFRNRLARNEKALRRWAKREGLGAWRLYDRDIPELPLALDIYLDARDPLDGDAALSISLYDRPYDKPEEEEAAWLALMAETAASTLAVKPELVFARTRRKMKGLEQYERLGSGRAERIVTEAGLSFIVNLSDYLDTGLFLDHRPLRQRIGRESAGKRVLNLFAYTGSFSVHAARGGAVSVTTVDLSNTYLAWAERNLVLNGLTGPSWPLIRADVKSFLAEALRGEETWDLIIADPPTFSNSKAAPSDFDVNLDWSGLVSSCYDLLSPGGALYFSTNSRRLKWDEALVPGSCIDISEESIPRDFRDRRVHRAWKISHP